MRTRILIAAMLCATVVSALARYVMPDLDTVPIDRVVTNLERMIREDPANIETRVNLARLYAMAYATRITEMSTFRTGNPTSPGYEKGQPYFGRDQPHAQPSVKSTGNAAMTARAKDYLTKAVAAYRAVLTAAPNHAVAAIGLGWTLKESGDRAGAIAALRRAVALGWSRDSTSKGGLMYGQRSLTEEAAVYLIELLDPVKDAAELATLNERLRELKRRGRVITPIAIPLIAKMSSEANSLIVQQG
jgi:tetratricopeptide (TPR) repeat protein